jgi:uncharacterized membrane protein (UPF0127 family)
MRPGRLGVLLLAVITLAGGCKDQAPVAAPASTGIPTTQMKIGSRTFTLEIARTEEQQQTGLMRRDSMPEDHGMIFVFGDDQVRNFWMKNTRFPLDIVFVDREGKTVSVHQMAAFDETNTSSDLPARYAIELNKGMAADASVKSGDVLEIPPAARSSP